MNIKNYSLLGGTLWSLIEIFNVSEKNITAIFRVKGSVTHKLVYKDNMYIFLIRFPYFMYISDFITWIFQYVNKHDFITRDQLIYDIVSLFRKCDEGRKWFVSRQEF
jgi:hypothetical protein